jgi:hypothetical protein
MTGAERQELHRRAVMRVHRIVGGTIVNRRPRRADGDIYTNGRWIAVRVAQRHKYEHETISPAGKSYRYTYECYGFSLHEHGDRRINPHLWALVVFDRRRWRVCLVPRERLRHVLTVRVMCAGRRPHWLWRYEVRDERARIAA